MKIVLIGPVYPYKGGIAHYTSLLYRALAQSHDVTLVSFVMQYPKLLFRKEQKDYLNDLFKIDETLFLDRYIPDNEVEKYFAACDLVVLPYESATQSGIVQIAYGFEKPVIVTKVGGLPEVVEDGVTGYVVEPKNPQAIAQCVADYFDNNNSRFFIGNIKKSADKYSWDRIVEKLEKF